MKFYQALLGIGAMILIAAPVHGQDAAYDTPLYSTPNQPTLDKNYGLPTFGMPGAELPRQRTQAPDPEPRADPNLLTEIPPITRPKARKQVNPTETPLFTTTQGPTSTDATTTGDFTTTGATTTRMTTDETDALMTTK